MPDAEQNRRRRVDHPGTAETSTKSATSQNSALARLRSDPVEVERAELPPGDYVSPGFWVYRPDAAFPHMRKGDKDRATWEYFRREIDHNWYVDGRSSTVGFVNRDEASILYNAARMFPGKRCLEIGCWRGWSSAHIAAGSGGLEIVDPVLADPVWRADVEGSLERSGHLDRVTLHGVASPSAIEELAASDPRPWSFIFIDGDHEGEAPSRDAMAVIEHAAPDALIMLHDLAAPSVARALFFLREQGWNTMVLQTAQIMGAAWRGKVEFPSHRPDPDQPWTLPNHLHSFPVSGESLAERVERFGSVFEHLARGGGADENDLLLSKKARDAIEALEINLDTSRARSENAAKELKDLRADTQTQLQAIATTHARVLKEVQGDAQQQVEAMTASLDLLKREHGAERWRLYRMVQTLQSSVTQREVDVERLEAEVIETRRNSLELSSRWAESEFQLKSSQGRTEVLNDEAQGLRKRLLAAELRRNGLFSDLVLVRQHRDDLAAQVQSFSEQGVAEELGLTEEQDVAEDNGHMPGEVEGSSDEPHGEVSPRAQLKRFVARGRSLVGRAARRARRGSKRLFRMLPRMRR